MELENQTSSSTETGSSTSAPESAPAAANAQTSTTAESTASAPQDGQAPAWTPDFKFKVMDKEYEIDPLFRPIIKDEETLKKIRRMQEQVLGLPHLEASRDEYKNKYTQVAPRLQEYDTVEQKLNKLSYLVQNKNFGSFFDELKIPRGEVLQWVKAELEAEQLPEHVRQQMEQNRLLQQQQWEYQQQLSYYQQQAKAAELEQINYTIDGAIQSGGSDVAAQFNARMQDQNAFRNAVINKGFTIQQTTGQKLPPSEVVNLVKADLARVMGITEQQVPANAAPQAGGAVAPQKVPVIPAVKAGGASPVKKAPRSLDELKKLASAI